MNRARAGRASTRRERTTPAAGRDQRHDGVSGKEPVHGQVIALARTPVTFAAAWRGGTVPRREPVLVGNGQGFWGDSILGPVRLVREGPLHYLTLDYLA